MSNVTPRPARTLLALLAAVLGVVLGVAGPAAATAAPRTLAETLSETLSETLAQPPCGDTASYDLVPIGDLPPEAGDTVDLIAAGGPFPYPQDGTVFQNRENLLPDCALGYYHEYTVETPGSPDRGARRIVTGDAGEHFYTNDHYASFVLVDLGGTPGGCGDSSGLAEVGLSTLPGEVADTVALVEAGGPYPYPEDDQVYQNREGVLPDCPAGYYRLYTVPTPGAPDRGERRLVAGATGDFFYTPDRYATFVWVDLNS